MVISRKNVQRKYFLIAASRWHYHLNDFLVVIKKLEKAVTNYIKSSQKNNAEFDKKTFVASCFCSYVRHPCAFKNSDIRTKDKTQEGFEKILKILLSQQNIWLSH